MKPEDLIPLKPDAFHVLLVLMDGPRHGYALMRDVLEATGGEVRLLPGALYRHLQRFLDDGLIVETGGPNADSRRRTYKVTDLGRAVAEAEASRLVRLVEAAGRRDLLGKKARA